MINQFAHSRRKPATGCKDKVDNALAATPCWQYADKGAVPQRLVADVVWQESDAQTRHRRGPQGAEIRAAHARRVPDEVRAPIIRFKRPVGFVLVITGYEEGVVRQVFDLTDPACQVWGGHKNTRRLIQCPHGEGGITVE